MSRRSGLRAALSPVHGASLATTAGITSVIVGVMAVGLLAQSPPENAPLGGWAGATVLALAVAAGSLYQARNRLGEALDGPEDAPNAAAAGRAWYHFGMGAAFAALSLAILWRLALHHGGWATVAAATTGFLTLKAWHQAFGWWVESNRRSRQRLFSEGALITTE